jgi:hypothetical protein
MRKLLLPSQIAQLLAISQNRCCARRLDDDRAVHLHQVFPETWALMLINLLHDSEGFRE